MDEENISDVGVILLEGSTDLVPDEARFPSNYEFSRIDDPRGLKTSKRRHDIEVVIFDRAHPQLDVEQFLNRIGSLRYQYQLAMVTVVEPDFEFVQEGVDAFISKPPTTEKIEATVTDLVEREVYARRRQAFCSLLSARKALEGEYQTSVLLANDEYLDVCERIKRLSEDLDKSNDRLKNETEFLSHLRDIEHDVSSPV